LPALFRTKISEYGRYDDLTALIDTKSSEIVLDIIQKQLLSDYESETPSLLAKWMPSENTSSSKTRKLAQQIREKLGASSKDYRKMLSKIRKQIKIVEHNLSNKEYKTIDYSKIPSQAGMKYKKAFKRNDEVRYSKYIEDVKEGKTTINVKTLYPYQIYKSVQNGDDVLSDRTSSVGKSRSVT